MEDTMIKNLKEKYGKSLEEWIDVVKKTGIQKHGEIIKFQGGLAVIFICYRNEERNLFQNSLWPPTPEYLMVT